MRLTGRRFQEKLAILQNCLDYRFIIVASDWLDSRVKVPFHKESEKIWDFALGFGYGVCNCLGGNYSK